MSRRWGILCAFSLLGAVAFMAEPAASQQSAVTTVAAKTSKGQKVCRVKLKYSGQVKTFVCAKNEPCCVWHEINYVKCGSPTFGCL
jgi:hypothetical protein